MDRKRIRVVGHRGARGLEPENTLRSFRRALELGVDLIECDVHMTRDGRAILMHDHTVDRTTNGTGAPGDFTFEAIRRLDAGQGEQVPTLEELLHLIRGKVEVHIELKDPTALLPVLDIVKAQGVRDQVFLTSGDTALLLRLREADPAIRVEHIFGNPPADAVQRALSVRASRVSCRFDHLTQAFVDESHSHGLEVIAWPPNTAEEQRHAIGFGVDIICTDRPDILIQTLREL
ncbi:MAG: glycerophosphodiester phosphodiesterase [Lentisphaeria bacterium]|nr:glycerophosphodiester phosphodiesterase [Lentisphaeria bacterium]